MTCAKTCLYGSKVTVKRILKVGFSVEMVVGLLVVCAFEERRVILVMR